MVRALRPRTARACSSDPDLERMSWWSRLLGGKSESDLKPQRLDYLNEALALERQGDYDAALTSYRLALRDQPNDHRVEVSQCDAAPRGCPRSSGS